MEEDIVLIGAEGEKKALQILEDRTYGSWTFIMKDTKEGKVEISTWKEVKLW